MLQRLEFQAMGTRMLALLDAPGESSILQNVPAWFEEWEQALSRFRTNSELSQLNTSTGSPRKVSEQLWEVFEAAVSAEALTHGLVTPVILNSLLAAGYDRNFELLERAGTGAGLITAAGRSLELESLCGIKADAHSRTLTVPSGVRLDFGGIAKGWAANQAVQRLKRAGRALVSAGGDVAVSGPQLDGEPWTIDVEDPFRDGQFLETIYLESGGVATSGKDHRHWMRNGALQHHVIDPRTGQPAETDILAATVIAPSAMEAEAFAKAVLISGSQAGMAWLDGDDQLAGLLVLENGQQLYSRNFERYL